MLLFKINETCCINKGYINSFVSVTCEKYWFAGYIVKKTKQKNKTNKQTNKQTKTKNNTVTVFWCRKLKVRR